MVKLRQSRDQNTVDSALSALTQCAETSDGNLLDLSIKAARVRCTVGEISDAMEKIVGRHVASTRMVSGAYISEYGEGGEADQAMEAVKVILGDEAPYWCASPSTLDVILCVVHGTTIRV